MCCPGTQHPLAQLHPNCTATPGAAAPAGVLLCSSRCLLISGQEGKDTEHNAVAQLSVCLVAELVALLRLLPCHALLYLLHCGRVCSKAALKDDDVLLPNFS
jgi:hypothetical protein